jgi:N-acyl-D-amino-acid deacylase
MTHDFDLVIRGGTVFDGSGGEPRRADVAILDGRIAAVGTIDGSASEELDATGLIVTPGFVDIHTHYDGQAIWADRMEPSSRHGVTTVVVGNCGVGFAPCRASDHNALIKVMEGVEDIPGVVMAAGLPWNWETFPEYLDALDSRPRDIDVGAYLPHSPLRVYVMGQRGVDHEPANADDIAKMQALTEEAIDAGALGFATSRTLFHRTTTGENIPSFQSEEKELTAIARSIKTAGGSVFQVVPDTLGKGGANDLDVFDRISREADIPITFSFGASTNYDVTIDRVEAFNENGAKLIPQVFPRPIGMILSHTLSWNPFHFCPSFAELADLPHDEKMAALRRPEVRARLIAEEPGGPDLPLAAKARDFAQMFPLSDPPIYEPAPETSFARQAEAAGVSPEEFAYDYLLQQNGDAKALVALGNFMNGSLDALGELMTRPDVIIGLGDGGAHYGLVCDASFPTFMLTHWVRDRPQGRLDLAWTIAALSRRPAEVVGLFDRGMIAPGYKADLNVIDPDGITLLAPTVVHDLPGGGRRLMQDAKGYRATIVNGVIISRDGIATDSLPGRLIRGPRSRPSNANDDALCSQTAAE